MMTSQTPVAMMGTPDWFSTSLSDVSTGMDFKINGFQNKVVLVETMATWCPNCLDQQKQIQAYLNAAGMNDQLQVVSLDIDMHEDSALLKSYASRMASNGRTRLPQPAWRVKLASYTATNSSIPPPPPF